MVDRAKRTALVACNRRLRAARAFIASLDAQQPRPFCLRIDGDVFCRRKHNTCETCLGAIPWRSVTRLLEMVRKESKWEIVLVYERSRGLHTLTVQRLQELGIPYDKLVTPAEYRSTYEGRQEVLSLPEMSRMLWCQTNGKVSYPVWSLFQGRLLPEEDLD